MSHVCEGVIDPKHGVPVCRICGRTMTMKQWRESGPNPVATKSAEIIAQTEKKGKAIH